MTIDRGATVREEGREKKFHGGPPSTTDRKTPSGGKREACQKAREVDRYEKWELQKLKDLEEENPGKNDLLLSVKLRPPGR